MNSLKQFARRFVPPTLSLKQYAVNSTHDMLQFLALHRDPLIPPTRLMFDGPPSIQAYKENGREYLEYFVNLCGLKPNEAILDVGCGIGRKAVALTGYLQHGSYEGFDTCSTGIKWCRTAIQSRYPHFRFDLSDVYNECYNPRGQLQASQYRFPYEDSRFDFAIATSLFTHLLPEAFENYIAEIARTLRVGGRCLLTFLLLNEESEALLLKGASSLPLSHDRGHYRINSLVHPEAAVGYQEGYVFDVCRNAGLEMRRPVYYGGWCGRDVFMSYQDIAVATKR
ncbi:class I SAM-dependent methyltransferase [Candidatus Nitrospira bockiana]